MHCPICASVIALDETVCPSCKTSVAEYRQVYYAPDILFNQGIDYIRQERYVDACDRLCAAASLKKDDLQILQAWAYAAEKAENIPLALNVLAEMMAIADDPETEKHYEALSVKLEKDDDTTRKLLTEILDVQSAAMEQMAAGMRGIVSKYGQ